MKEYMIVPEFRYSKTFPFAFIIYQFVTAVFVLLGYHVTGIAYSLAFIFQICVIYYLCLYLINKYCRLHIRPDIVTVWNIFNKPKQYQSVQLCWKIKRIPWYNSYFLCLYSTRQKPVAILKPHWKNALKLLHFPHYGSLTSVELKYIKFLKNIGLL